MYVLQIQINPNDPATKYHFYTGIVELDTSKKIPCYEMAKHTPLYMKSTAQCRWSLVLLETLFYCNAVILVNYPL